MMYKTYDFDTHFVLDLEYRLTGKRVIASSSLIASKAASDNHREINVIKTLVEKPLASRFFLFPQISAVPPSDEQKKLMAAPLVWKFSADGEVLSSAGEPVDLDVWRWGCFPMWWATEE